ncbi:MAG: SIS domain-containing protein [Candidatus Asgardarchaeia archaeon]
MIRTYVPILEEDLENAYNVARNTSYYLIDQTKENIISTFKREKESIIQFLNALSTNKMRRIHFAARGRSLYMGARTLADRLVQLQMEVVYPSLEQYIVYDPTSIIVKGDLVIAISTSGFTSKVIKKVDFAKSIGCDVYSFTINSKSHLADVSDITIIFDDRANDEKIKANYNPQPITPLGTNSEFTQLILMEALAVGLRDLLYNVVDVDNAFENTQNVAIELLDNAKNSLDHAYSKCSTAIKDFLANLLLKYYSQQTVHFCARGKTFNMAVGPFKMRLDQIPNAFVTSILDFEPLNRPVRKGQVTIAVSGSGMAYPIAKMAKEKGSMLITISSYHNKLIDIGDVVIILPGRKETPDDDWDLRQWKGWKSEFAPKGTIFEVSATSLLEGIFAGIVSYIGISEEDMRQGHANIE